MNDKILAVFTVQDQTGIAQAQMCLRENGELVHYGDCSKSIDALALLLRVGPEWIKAQRDTRAEG